MAVQTADKKLDGAGLTTVWGLLKSLYNSFVAKNEVKIIGQITNMPPNTTFAQHSLIGVDQEVFINSEQITGVPSHVVTHNNSTVTHNGVVVTHGANTTVTWKKITM
jgi:hypothetical protein